MKVKSEAQFFFCDIYLIPQDLPRKCLGQSQSVPIGAVRASDKPNPAGEALKKARTTNPAGFVLSEPRMGEIRAD